jgi:hypothetical protein
MSFMVLGEPEAHEWLVPKLPLGTKLAAKLSLAGKGVPKANPGTR